MNKDVLKKISSQQTERFFYSYASDWRLSQLLAIEKILADRYVFFDDIVSKTKSPDATASNEAIIAQQITNGLFFEAISIAIQSIEDLFALLNAGQKPLKFISGIISYSAGKVDNLLKQKYNKEAIATLFYFPVFNERYETDEQHKVYEDSLEFLYQTILEIQDFYKKFRFFYNQYKHGLCVALRAYTDYSTIQIEDHKKRPNSAYLNAFDNISISKLDNEDIRGGKKIMMPYLTKEISENMQHLLHDDNLLRFVSPNDKIEFNDFKLVVKKSRVCISTIGNNIVSSLKEEYPMKLQLPANLDNNAYVFSFPKEVYIAANNKKIFI